MNELDYILNYRLAYTFLVLIVGYLSMAIFMRNVYFYALFHFIGTFLHEIAHYVISFILNGKPSSFSIFPKIVKKTLFLGYVESSNATWYNRLPIGLSPLLILIPLYYFDLYYFDFMDKTIYSIMVYFLISSILLINSIPSVMDFRMAFGCITGLLFYTFLIVLIYKYFTKGQI